MHLSTGAASGLSRAGHWEEARALKVCAPGTYWALSPIFRACELLDETRSDGFGLGLFVVKSAADLLGHASRFASRLDTAPARRGGSVPFQRGSQRISPGVRPD
jgi:hypothetical protein